MLVGYKKGISVFMSLLIVFSVFSVYSVSAVHEFPLNCCLEVDGNYCVNLEEDISSCSEDNLRLGPCDSIESCGMGTCVPANGGACLTSYTSAQCDAEGGAFHPGFSESQVSACDLGCCADSLECGIMQQQECNGEFINNIAGQGDCLLECRPETTGCCVESNSCTYQTTEDSCGGDFIDNKYCYEENFCNVRYTSHAYTYLGDASLILEADKDVYWYDSNGNMEERVGEVDLRTNQIVPIPGAPEGLTLKGDCDYPDEIAFDPDGSKGGRDNAYCKSTACVVDCENCEPSSFKNGESICLNIFGGKYMNEDRSTALREYVLSCNDGEIDDEGIIEDRSRVICIDDTKTYNIDGDEVSRKYARADIDNAWQSCLGCGGESSGIFDYGGYIPGFGGILVPFGTWCASDDNLLGKVPGSFGLGATECEGVANNQGVQMCYYDHDLWAPIGSCNPIYPPAKNNADQCNICGKGGDGRVNMCTEQECNALGDCQFEGGSLGAGLVASGSLALGIAAGGLGVASVVCTLPWFQPWSACMGGALGLTQAAAGSSLYWGVFGIIFGLGAGSQSDYDELAEYGYDFETPEGKYNLAPMIAMARAIDYALGDEGSIEQGEELSEVGEDMNYIADSYAGTLIWLVPALVMHEVTGLWAFSETLSPILSTTAGIISIYSVSESFNTGNCVPETAYTNSDHCGECGGLEGQFYCTQERCGILGEDSGYCHWEAKNDGTADGTCLSSNPTDTTPPGITSIELQMFDQDLAVTLEKNVNTNQMTTEQVSWFDAAGVEINLVTDEPAKCAASFESSLTYETMSGGELAFDGSYETDHELKFNLTAQQKMNGENTLYIKCRDVSGGVNGEHDDINWIKMLFGVEPNSVPPEIIEIQPANALNLPAGTLEIEVKLTVQDRLDEVTECKYQPANTDPNGYVVDDEGNIEPINYGDLNNLFTFIRTMSCPGSALQNDCSQFKDTIVFDEGNSIELDLISQGYSENGTIYPYTFGCKDSYGNPVLMDYGFTIYPGFDMNITYPTGGLQIYDSTPEVNISVEVDAYCRYKIDNDVNWTRMNTGVGMPFVNSEIEDPLSANVAGVPHRLIVNCIDMGNDVVEKTINFFVMSDAAAPLITRVYTRGIMGSSGRLHIELNEEAECRYSSEDSSFEDSTLMNAVPPTLVLGERILSDHQTATLDSFKYYIKCRDEWDNEGSYTIYP
jgi:hypothetical protein